MKDDIVVGLDDADIAALGSGDVTALGRALVDQRVLTLMQYAVRKGADGELELAPLRRVSVLAHDSIRVEPYRAQLRVVPVA